MAVYSEAHQYIFFANPQTASKAISLTLRSKLGGVLLPDHEIRRGGEVVAQVHHTTYRQILDAALLPKTQLDALFKVTCIRNPFDQLVSKYIKYCTRFGEASPKYKWRRNGTKGDDDFGQWLRWISDQWVAIDKIENGPMEFVRNADLIIRFEALQEGFDEFLRRIGVAQPLPLFDYNLTKARSDAVDPSVPDQRPAKKPYTAYYDEDSVRLVSELYAPILERFDYRFGA